jgi:hypothetical protein
MKTIKALLLASCVSLASRPVSAQATEISAPDDYLLRITQRWAAASPLGSLPARRMAPGDVELRVWGGYGLTRTGGVILRRTAGRWQTWRAYDVRCHLNVAIPIADTASAATESLYVALAHKRCGASIGDTHGAARLYDADTLVVENVAVNDPEAVWKHVVALGGLELPPKVPRKWRMMDGFTYVIETRRGDSYRASVIEALEKPEVDADRVARSVYDAVMSKATPAGR